MNVLLDARTAMPRFPGIGRVVQGVKTGFESQHSEWPQLSVSLLTNDDGDHTSHGFWENRQRVTRASVFSPLQGISLRGVVRREDIDVFHRFYPTVPALPDCANVATVFDLIPIDQPQFVSRKARTLLPRAFRKSIESSSRVITPSRFTASRIAVHFPEYTDKVRVVNLAVDDGFRNPDPDAVAEFRKRERLPQPFVLTLGVQTPHKNLDGLIASWNRISGEAAARDWTLIVAGCRDPLGVTASRIQRMGYVPDHELPLLLAAADLFVFPSLHEGFGLPPLEAMAAGTAVVCSNRDSLPEVCGRAARYFNPDEPGSLDEALLDVMENGALRQELERSASRQAGMFSWERHVRELMAVYCEL